jgi:hypothetical protein
MRLATSTPQVHWVGGVHTELRVRKNKTGHNKHAAEDSVVEMVSELAKGWPDSYIGGILNRIGCQTGPENSWSENRVESFRGQHQIQSTRSAASARDASFWLEQVPAFADKARLIVIDLPGHGQSDKPHVYYTMDFFASSVSAVLRHEHICKAILVGHGMGVAVICRIHAQAPDKVAGLVAVDGFLRTKTRPREESEKFVAPYRGAGYREQVRRSVNAMFPIPATEALHEQVLPEMLMMPQYVILSTVESLSDPDERESATAGHAH